MPSSTEVVLPSVFYNSVTKDLCFISETELDGVPVEVADEAGNVWLQRSISVE